ncbi:hypothetical protein [Lysobacter sp. A3-1-A15]|uniref:hypothetical protein n=1 Tax=Novilysobacter viscosus TaxID=3098602 RepID=UPI002EDA873F
MIAIWILGGIAFSGVLWWALSADFNRFARKRKDEPLYPESLFKVAVTDSEIIAHRPDGTVERVSIAELKELYIVTTSAGPWSPDVWWLFVGSASGSGCSFPGGASGEHEALHFAQQLPGFDNAAFITAMGSTSDAKFLCWQAAA